MIIAGLTRKNYALKTLYKLIIEEPLFEIGALHTYAHGIPETDYLAGPLAHKPVVYLVELKEVGTNLPVRNHTLYLRWFYLHVHAPFGTPLT